MTGEGAIVTRFGVASRGSYVSGSVDRGSGHENGGLSGL